MCHVAQSYGELMPMIFLERSRCCTVDACVQSPRARHASETFSGNERTSIIPNGDGAMKPRTICKPLLQLR